MTPKAKKTGYRQTVRQIVEESLVPAGVRLLPCIELEGEKNLAVRRHGGLLEYSAQRVLVLAGGLIYEIEGAGMVIVQMSDDFLRIRGRILGIKVINQEEDR